MSQLSGDMMDMRPINTRPPARPERYDATGVKAVLGPTNTGKTWLAIERMVAHSSGVIGLPLRLWRGKCINASSTGWASGRFR